MSRRHTLRRAGLTLVEVMIAPQVTPGARDALASKQNLRLLEVPLGNAANVLDFKRVGGGMLLSSVLKFSFDRPRPDLVAHLVDVRTLSFPSGHALTICCVAVIFTCVWPLWWPVWFAVAALLAVTRALLTAHFLSDVLIGAGIGLIAAREVLLLGFPGFAPYWF